MEKLECFNGSIRNIKTTQPLVHQITNHITANDCANATLAIGAIPIMAESPCEVEEITSRAQALVLNLGTLSESKLDAMLKAGKTAQGHSIPIVFDPVGVGISKFRATAADKILTHVRPTIIRGNISEIKTLVGSASVSIGVNNGETNSYRGNELNVLLQLVAKAARKLGSVVVCTGKLDIISDGNTIYTVENGHPMMTDVTGMGCMCSAIIGAYAGAINDFAAACVLGAATCGIAGEQAFQKISARKEGSGSFRTRVIDELYLLNEDQIARESKIHRIDPIGLTNP